MNTMGKILVILNLLIALATGLFLVFLFATRTNWKRGYDELKVELTASRANTLALKESNDQLQAKLKKAVAGQDSNLIAGKSKYSDQLLMIENYKKQAD